MRHGRVLICAIALSAALPLCADMRGVLHEPREGVVLLGGSRATVTWSSPQLPRFVEEWEAFLSVDGGTYYAYRITPHLELGQRTFTFEVPNVETERARFLIRAGDERREIEIELPATFTIRRDDAKALTAGHLAIIDSERGEAARPGDRGVIQWIDGDRSGRHLILRSALRLAPTLCNALVTEAPSESAEEPGPRFAVTTRSTTFLRTLTASLPRAHLESRPRAGRDVLLLQRRLNL